MPPAILFCRSNPVAPDPRVEKEARALARAGYRVHILGWDRSGELNPHSWIEQVKVTRLPIRAGFGRGLGNLPQVLAWQLGLASWLIQHQREYDLIHACDFDTVLPAVFAKWLYGKQVVYDIFDFYADHLRATPSWAKEIIRKIDLAIINRVDAVLLVDDARRKQIAGSAPHRLAVIYNSPEDSAQELAESKDTLAGDGKTDGKPGKLGLVYVGLIQVERGLLELLDVMQRHPEWTLDLAGYGGDEKIIIGRCLDCPNVRWHGRVPYEQTLRMSQQADILIATYDPAIVNHRYASPNKIFEAMMLSKPIIVAENTNMDQIVRQADCGYIIEYGNVRQLEDAIAFYADEPQMQHQHGLNARRAYEQQYSWEKMRLRLLELYQQLASAAGEN